MFNGKLNVSSDINVLNIVGSISGRHNGYNDDPITNVVSAFSLVIESLSRIGFSYNSPFQYSKSYTNYYDMLLLYIGEFFWIKLILSLILV